MKKNNKSQQTNAKHKQIGAINRIIQFFLTIFVITLSISASISCSNGNTSYPQTSQSQTLSGTISQLNAVRCAKNYLRVMAFSRQGLIYQLEFEGYSTADATYGADNSGANWYEQAAKKAKEYLRVMPYSRKGLIDQLEFEGFTYEQAVYGVEENGF